MASLTGKKIIIGLTGSIAVYKTCELVRRLKDHGAEIRVVMTESSQQFITPMTLQALSANPVHTNLLDHEAEAAMGHIELAKWADLILIAPLSANTMAKLANGMANDLLTTLCLATTAPIILAPAMNQAMWKNKINQYNYNKLAESGFVFYGPESGNQACGDNGVGRLQEPEIILENIISFFHPNQNKILQNKKIIITAGPTIESIDPVRYLSNYSSGKMGYAIAEAARDLGAEVLLVSGPTHIAPPKNIKIINIKTAEELLLAVKNNLINTHLFISTAAVADYKVENIAEQKIKKNNNTLQLNLIKNPDILSWVAQQTPKPFIIGFAAETENLADNALTKLNKKNLDLIIGNLVGEDMGFNSDHNSVTVYSKNSEKNFPLDSKKNLAKKLIHFIAEHYNGL